MGVQLCGSIQNKMVYKGGPVSRETIFFLHTLKDLEGALPLGNGLYLKMCIRDSLRGGKYSAFEGGTRVPVIVHWPQAINKPEVRDVLISQIDWLASLASLVDARIPKGSAPDSYNRLANLLGQDKTDRKLVFLLLTTVMLQKYAMLIG